jgi:hypothetical protein
MASPVPAWEERAKKLDARKRRIAKHGRSLMTAVRSAEERRAKRLNEKKRPGRKGAGR